jgi:hypothetical protein
MRQCNATTCLSALFLRFSASAASKLIAALMASHTPAIARLCQVCVSHVRSG